MFIVKDALCDGTKWHVRKVPANPAVDPYFPIGQAAMNIVAEQGKLTVTLKTMTPNLDHFEVQFDDQGWCASSESFTLNPRDGRNRLSARTVNKFAIKGPVAVAEVAVTSVNKTK
jgi:hypothetical protein